MSSVKGMAIVLMGVSGAGKSTIGEMLAKAINGCFLDADDYHSQANKDKMKSGVPLTDEDRIPWLENLRDAIRPYIVNGETVVLGCSALKKHYREILRCANPGYIPGSYSTCNIKFVLLDVSAEVLAARLMKRAADGNHFMPANLLQSQLDSLQIDESEGIPKVDSSLNPQVTVDTLDHTAKVPKMSPSTVHASDSAEESYTIETEKDFAAGDKPKVLRKRDSMRVERQISVDPISISEKTNLHNFIASKTKLLSCSLPSSASSSPKQQPKKKCNNQRQGMVRQHSVALANLEKLQEIHLQRSKSCREGRSCQPSIDFDLWSNKTSDRQLSYDSQRRSDNEGEEKVACRGGFSKGSKEGKSYEEKFKCGAMCLFIPGFGKGKAVRSKYEQEELEMETETGIIQSVQSTDAGFVSHKVSMEKFECGSWRSSAVMNSSDEDGDATSNMFFDLPVELIRCSTVNDTDSVVTAGFTFDNKDNQRNIKGVLKNPNANASGHPRNSCESSRHVRFSTSSPISPTCVTPRLRKARDEFTVFLEAQSG